MTLYQDLEPFHNWDADEHGAVTYNQWELRYTDANGAIQRLITMREDNYKQWDEPPSGMAEVAAVIRSLATELQAARDLLATATTFSPPVPTGCAPVEVQKRGNDLWVAYSLGYVLNHDGSWEYEPLPSSRTEEFIARTRYATAREAIEAVRKLSTGP